MVDSRSRRSVDDPPPAHVGTADLLGALSVAADLAVGLPAEHAVRSCYIGMCLAAHLRLPPDDRAALYYAELLMDAGCTAWTSHLAAAILADEISARRDFVFLRDHRNPLAVLGWLTDYVAVAAPAHVRAQRMLRFALHGREEVREGFRNTCAVAQRFAQRLGMPEAVQTALLAVFEQWDGSGPNGVRGDRIPLTARIVYATSFLEAFHHIGGREAAMRLARQRKGAAFDPTVVDAFLAVCAHEGFWEGLEQESVWATVLSMEPPSPYHYVTTEKLDDIALAFADLADLKSRYMAGHSRRVAELAQRMAGRLRLPGAQVATIYRAALLHDLGLVAVPSFIKAVISLTTGLEDAERVTAAFLVAVGAAEQGRPTLMFLTKEAVRLALRGFANAVACDGCPPVASLLQRYDAAGGRYVVCPICFDARKLDQTGLLPNAELGGTVPLWQWIGEDGAATFSF